VDSVTGKVTGVGPGVANITAEIVPFEFYNSGGIEAGDGYFGWSYDIYVPTPAINIIRGDNEVVNGRTIRLMTYPDDDYSSFDLPNSVLFTAQAVTSWNEPVTWSGSDKKRKIVNIEDDGQNGLLVEARGSGTATLTAKTLGGKTATVKVKVAPRANVEIERADGFVAPVVLWTPTGEYDMSEIQLLAFAKNTLLKWKASKSGIVELKYNEEENDYDEDSFDVDDKTLVTVVAKKAGTVTLTATDSRKKSASISITVRNPVTSLQITNFSDPEIMGFGLKKGASKTLKAAVNKNATVKTLIWESSDPTIASVTSKGVVKGISAGEATITVRSKDSTEISDEISVNVYMYASKVAMAQSNFSMRPGARVSLNALTTPALESLSAYEFLWFCDTEDVVSFYEGTRESTLEVYALELPPGKTSQKVKLYAYDYGSGKSASVEITVSETAQPIENMRLTKHELSLKRGKSTTLKVAMNEGVNPETNKKWAAPGNKNLRWRIDCEYTWDGRLAKTGSIATIDSTGKVVAKGRGYAIVMVEAVEDTNELFYDSCKVICS
jgi:uncharacterized protein YjdB